MRTGFSSQGLPLGQTEGTRPRSCPTQKSRNPLCPCLSRGKERGDLPGPESHVPCLWIDGSKGAIWTLPITHPSAVSSKKWAISISRGHPRFHVSNYVFIRGVSGAPGMNTTGYVPDCGHIRGVTYPWDEYRVEQFLPVCARTLRFGGLARIQGRTFPPCNRANLPKHIVLAHTGRDCSTLYSSQG